jgi:hypothetical protein
VTEPRPRISFVIPCRDPEFVIAGVLPSLGPELQRDINGGTYEIVLVGSNPDEYAVSLPSMGVPVCAVHADLGRDWLATGLRTARGDYVAILDSPGVASPTLVSCIEAALDAHPAAALILRTFELDNAPGETTAEWLARHELPQSGHTRFHAATVSLTSAPSFRWLDPLDTPVNVVLPRAVAVVDMDGSRSVSELCGYASARVQLIGDALFRPRNESAPREEKPEDRERVDPDLEFFGRVHRPERWSFPRPRPSGLRSRPRLSVIVVTYDMARELPRTLASVDARYQRGIAADDYEVVVVDNGSKAPLSAAEVARIAPFASYHVLANAPPSPARAINYGVSRATGDALAIMIDGACLLSPGVLAGGIAAFRTFPCPVVVTRYFYLGRGDQNQTVHAGYDQREEDRLLESVRWQEDGYRLFDIASPLTLGGPVSHWLSGWFESNCLMLARSVFEQIGGCDERFDFPGGGFLNVDLLFRACGLSDVQPVQLLGEGTFHQVHGGITTNTSESELALKERGYLDQYMALRGEEPHTLPQNFYFMGRLPRPSCMRKMYG